MRIKCRCVQDQVCLLPPHLELPHFILGCGIGNVGGVRGTDSLLSQSQPGVQVGVFLHKLVPEDPLPLQPGKTEEKQLRDSACRTMDGRGRLAFLSAFAIK